MKKLLIFLSVFSILSCQRFDISGELNSPMIVYKTEQDYSEYLRVIISDDKSEIVGIFSPEAIDTSYKPTALINNYYTFNLWLNEAYTDIKLSQWQRIRDSLNAVNYSSIQFLFEHIINFDPFSEFYIDHENIIDYQPDTAFINDLIRNNELNKYLERIK